MAELAVIQSTEISPTAAITEGLYIRWIEYIDAAPKTVETYTKSIKQFFNYLAAADTLLDSVGKEYRLKEALELIEPLYDYAIIDTPPALGILTVNALTAATAAIVPAQADIYSLQGIAQLSNTVNTIKKYCNPELAILGIVLTRYNSRAIISRELAELISSTAAKLNTKAYSTKIRECTAIKESQAVRECIYTYAPKSNAAADYSALLSEIITEI